MSTIRIDDALEMLETRGKAEGNGLVNEAVRDARAELEAIRKAAQALKTWNDNGGRGIDIEAARGFGVIESIAKETP